MSINGIGEYIALNSLYGQESNSSGSSDPLLAVSSSKQTDIYSMLGTGSSSSSSDSVDFSQTAGFFSKLSQLEQTDPDKYKEVVKKLGERLQGSRGYEGYALSNLSQQVADGADISDVILQGSTGTDTYTSKGTLSSQIEQLISSMLDSTKSDE